MRNGRPCAFARLAPVIALALQVIALNAQSVISTHAGVIHFFEGAVYLGDQRLESRLGKFPSMSQGAELRTAEGRAEVLLTPGVFLRMGELSSIRMVANSLADTQVELLAGSAIVDAGEPNSGTSVTVIYKDWKIHILEEGVYRIDSDPPRLSVHHGEAEVLAGASGAPIPVEHGMVLPLTGVLVPEHTSDESGDALNDWANGRNESISADNAITAQIDEDPASRTSGSDGFAYFPFLGLPPIGPASSGLYGSSSGLYGSMTPYQSGFNSIYLPGYTYQPLMLGLLGRGLRTYLPSPPRRIGISPGTGGIGSAPRVPPPHPAVVVTPRVVTPRVVVHH